MSPRSFTTPQGEHITLSPDQDKAIDRIMEALKKPGAVAILTGAAGCGKTVLMFLVIELWPGNVILMGPTGKAAVRLSETTARKAITVHSGIFRAVEEREPTGDRRNGLLFGEPAPPRGCGPDTLVIVDEGSMMNQPLTQELVKQVRAVGGRVLGVLDHEQLPPVEGKWGFPPDKATATLAKVHRQALESAVLDLATCLREGRGMEFNRWGDEVQKVDPCTIEQAVEWVEAGREVDSLLQFVPDAVQEELTPSRVLLTWTNKVRVRANRLVRQRRGYERGVVQAGETIIGTMNNHALGRMNGELIEVTKVETCDELTECLGTLVQWVTETTPDGSEMRFLAVPAAFDAFHPRKSERQVLRELWRPLWAAKRPRPNRDGTMPESSAELMHRMGWGWDDLRDWRDTCRVHQLQATWGYCLTVHKAQGSQWDEVGFISCPSLRRYSDRDFVKRLYYTGVTRAKVRFTAFVLQVIPNYNRKNPYGEE